MLDTDHEWIKRRSKKTKADLDFKQIIFMIKFNSYSNFIQKNNKKIIFDYIFP